MDKRLNNLTAWLTRIFGRAWATVLAILLIVFWLLGLPFVGLSDTYQLVINTTTTIITFIMVFFVLNTQNRDNKGIHFKLDLLLLKMGVKDPHKLRVEDLPDGQIERELTKMVGYGKRK